MAPDSVVILLSLITMVLRRGAASHDALAALSQIRAWQRSPVSARLAEPSAGP